VSRKLPLPRIESFGGAFVDIRFPGDRNIRFPGDRTKEIDRPAKDADKARFAAQWKAFEAGDA
jgi:hypothetical protein